MADNISGNPYPNNFNASPATNEMVKALDEAKKKIANKKKAEDAINNAPKSLSIPWMMVLMGQLADAQLGKDFSLTLGPANAMSSIWHDISKQVSGLTNIVKYNTGVVINPTDANGKPLHDGGMKITGIDNDGNLLTVDRQGNAYPPFSITTPQGTLVPGVPMFDFSDLPDITLINPSDTTKPPDPIQSNPTNPSLYTFKATSSNKGYENFANKAIMGGFTATQQVKTDLLNVINDFREPNGLDYQLKKFGVDVSSLTDTFQDFDDQIAQTTNLPFTIISSEGVFKDIGSSLQNQCQTIKSGAISAKGVTETASRALNTNFSMQFNSEMTIYNTGGQAYFAGISAVFSDMKNIISNTGK